MNQTPPIPLAPRARPPRPAASHETGCPAPRDRPLPIGVPHPAHLPPPAPVRPMVLALAALALCSFVSCAQLDFTGGDDAGPAAPAAAVSFVAPIDSSISPDAGFVVQFATPMDASLLLSDVDRSQTVVLVARSNAQVMAAALGHARLTAAEEALLIPANAALGDRALSVSLAPLGPLGPGDYALLVASRLKDAAGQKLTGQSEFDYSVAAPPPEPTLLDPLAGSSAPADLLRVRAAFSFAAPGRIVSLVGPSGIIAAAAAPPDAGEAVISLCPQAPCAALVPGESYALALDGTAVPGAVFSALGCARDGGPVLSASAIEAGDVSAQLHVALDRPALVRVQLANVSSAADGGSAAPSTQTPSASLFVSCATSGCGSASSCAGDLDLSGLAPATPYSAALTLDDDEGNQTALAPRPFATQGALPVATLEEVMASPPPPEPRDEGEYVEIHNGGSGAIDLTLLALQGADGTVRPLLGSPPPTQLLLAPGGYALAVGASFDASRYVLPAGVPVLRASTQRLLGRGLADSAPPSFALVAVGADGGSSAVLSSFPGGDYDCAPGESLERVHPDPGPLSPSFACGALGGSPGRAP